MNGFKFDTTYTSLPSLFFKHLNPEKAPEPRLVVLNHELAASLGLDFSGLSQKAQAEMFSGNKLPDGAEPFAQAYAGHQFGHLNILGDGRAHIWGEHITPEGKRIDIQFKGSGRTPYSRRGDGKAVLGPMLREYIIAEAMHNLGIPTTRSLAVVTTGERVMREAPLPGAALTRTADSHIRVGTFELAAIHRDVEALEKLLDYTINRHDPDLKNSSNKALDFIRAVMSRQVDLIVNWMRVGFIHGVMNTDNMAISGETIDYGPCAFMDAYDPNTVFSSIDHMGRYAYGNQPHMAQWNLARLAQALLPLIDDDIQKAVNMAEDVIDEFSALYETRWLAMMAAKIGLTTPQKGDKKLIEDLLAWMHQNGADYTNTFRALTDRHFEDEVFEDKAFKAWLKAWQERRKTDAKTEAEGQLLMAATNPAIIPRNHRVEEALEAATAGNIKPFNALVAALKTPYENTPDLAPYQIPPAGAQRVYQTFCGT